MEIEPWGEVISKDGKYPIEPSDIDARAQPMETFGKAEIEIAAMYVTRLAQQAGNWKPLKKDRLILYLKQEGYPWSFRESGLVQPVLDWGRSYGGGLLVERKGKLYFTSGFVDHYFSKSPSY